MLEITETALGDDDAIHEQLEELDRLGVVLSIDDFGTGYSSLARLRSSPVGFVKLDRAFVEEVTDAGSPAPMLQAIMAMAMAAGLGVEVVAEGIETAEQLAQLRAMGCQAGQGFLLSRPVDPDTIAALLSSGEPLAPMAACARPPVLGGGALEAVITDAISNPAVDLDHLIRPILDQLQAITGFDSAYLTRIDWAKLEQHITHAHNTGALAIAEGAVVEWSDTLCRRALEHSTSCIVDVAAAHPDCTAAVELGIVSYATATVEPEPGVVYGTLCAASSRPVTLSAGQHAAMQLFARLIAEKLPDTTRGRQGGPAPPALR